MNIDSVNIGRNYPASRSSDSSSKASQQESLMEKVTTSGVRSDKLEISAAASNLGLHRARIKSGYYDKPEIIRETAERLYKSIQEKNTTNKQ